MGSADQDEQGEGRHAAARLALVSHRRLELREILVPRENLARQALCDFLAEQGVADPEQRTVTLLTRVDGLVIDRLVNGGSVAEEEIRGLETAALSRGVRRRWRYETDRPYVP
ncbi:hypothetical protein [Streptomyces sp. NPDC052107]|uniref:hypothetical protein n=1 Tax=Streptomyces sp. NPDC052107 TaxID=3155632 RepID=UPI00343A2B97